MFDQPPQGGATSAQPVKEPEDIFAGAESAPAPKPAPATPSSPPPPPPPPQLSPQAPVVTPPGVGPAVAALTATPSKKGMWIIVGAIVLVLLLGGGFWWFSRSSGNEEIAESPSLPSAVAPSSTEEAPATPAPAPVVMDTDSDGLTDDEERASGTDPVKADTDGDGLTDREEREVWKTDPLKADTDGDTYLDGQEVQNGYNPNGPGKLLDLQSSINTTPQ